MEDSSKSILTSILDYLLIALRYIASGFVALAVYTYLYNPQLTEMKGIGGILIFAAATIGIVTYALHFATLDKVFYGICVKKFVIETNGFLPAILYTQINDWEKAKGKNDFDFKQVVEKRYKKKTEEVNNEEENTTEVFSQNKIKRKILFALANQTYLRSLSNNKMLSEMQKQVEKRLSLLNFLYCSLYQIVIITLYFTITHIDTNATIYWPYVWKILLLFAIAGLFLYSAYKFNCRICSREMWLVQNFEQSVDEIKRIDKEYANKTTANIGIANSGV